MSWESDLERTLHMIITRIAAFLYDLRLCKADTTKQKHKLYGDFLWWVSRDKLRNSRTFWDYGFHRVGHEPMWKYISLRRFGRMEKKVKTGYSLLLNDKFLFSKLAESLSFKVPCLLGLIENNRNPENRGKLNNNHPTVKPIALMKYLVNLVSREGHKVLDPFMGSGTTGIACKELGREFIGIEKEKEYFEIAQRRINDIQNNRGDFN